MFKLWSGGLLALWWCAAASATVVDFSLQPPSVPVAVDTTFMVDMQIATALGHSQSVAGLRVLLQWDPADITLIGVRNNGSYPWLLSRFPDDSALDGLNDTWSDGDAKYEALASLGNPAVTTSAGLVVASLEFRALRPVAAASIAVPATLGLWSQSQIFGGDEPNQDVTGALVGATVTVVPEPAGSWGFAGLLGVIGIRAGCRR